MLEEAAIDFEAVTQNSIPHQAIYWMAQVALGDAWLELGRPADALRIYNMFSKRKQRIASLDRYDRRVNTAFGKLLVKAGRNGDALEAFSRALEGIEDKKAPSESAVRYEMGLAYQAAGKPGKAMAEFKLAAGEIPAAAEALKKTTVSA
jgi:tetratricopeptide (TPR) repeat protein